MRKCAANKVCFTVTLVDDNMMALKSAISALPVKLLGTPHHPAAVASFKGKIDDSISAAIGHHAGYVTRGKRIAGTNRNLLRLCSGRLGDFRGQIRRQQA